MLQDRKQALSLSDIWGSSRIYTTKLELLLMKRIWRGSTNSSRQWRRSADGTERSKRERVQEIDVRQVLHPLVGMIGSALWSSLNTRLYAQSAAHNGQLCLHDHWVRICTLDMCICVFDNVHQQSSTGDDWYISLTPWQLILNHHNIEFCPSTTCHTQLTRKLCLNRSESKHLPNPTMPEHRPIRIRWQFLSWPPEDEDHAQSPPSRAIRRQQRLHWHEF
jgi:hypothetical protein